MLKSKIKKKGIYSKSLFHHLQTVIFFIKKTIHLFVHSFDMNR